MIRNPKDFEAWFTSPSGLYSVIMDLEMLPSIMNLLTKTYF
jgi:hypothetical protein